MADDTKTVQHGTLTRSLDPGEHRVPRARLSFDPPAPRYEELGELGRGGMGRVVDAVDRALVRPVAIKHVLGDSPGALARFDREARITARLEHPAIVPVYDVGRGADGTPYYVMRRVDGRPLDELVRCRTLDERLALVPNVLAACDALAYAHARSIIHRDIKPSNVLVGPFGETLVIDWGLAREADELDDSAGHVAGTPGFMAPEQARGDALDARADVYALGALLFFTLAGTSPVDAAGATAMVAHAAANQAPAWERLPAGVPSDLRTIVEKAMASDRAQRYPDAGALAADLRRFVTGNLVAAHRYTRGEQLLRFVRRHRAAVTIGLASLVVLGVGGAFAVARVLQARDAAIAQATLAEQRADELTLAKAWLLLDTHPTHAVASVRPLATSGRWREVAAIGAAARARGVAWRLLSPAEAVYVGMSPEGTHAFAIGSDGVYRVYDLATRTMHVAGERGKPTRPRDVHASMLDATTLAVFDSRSLAIIDVPTRARREVPLSAPAIAVLEGRHVLWWLDAERRAWHLASDRTAAVAVPIDDELEAIHPGLDDSSVVIAGRAMAWHAEPGETPVPLIPERVVAFGADPSNRDFVYATADGLIRQLHVWDIAGVPLAGSTVLGTGTADAIYPTPTRVALADRSPFRPRVANRTIVRGELAARTRDGIVVTGNARGAVKVWDGRREIRLSRGDEPLHLLLASARSPYVLTLGDDLLLWNIDHFVPHPVPDSTRDTLDVLRVAGPHHVLAIEHDRTWWLDLHTGARTDGPRIVHPHLRLATSPSGARGVAVANGATYAIRRGTTERASLASDGTHAQFVDEKRVVIARAGGVLELHDLARGTRTTLVSTGPDIEWLRARADHAVVGTAAHAVRVQLSTRASTRISLVKNDGAHLDAAGDVWFAEGRELVRWRRDGRRLVVATLPEPAQLLVEADAAHLVIDAARGGYAVDLATGSVRQTPRLEAQKLSGQSFYTEATGSGSGVLAVPLPGAGVRMIDGVSGLAWTLDGIGSGAAGAVALTLDGSLLYEKRERALHVLPVALPRTPSETAQLVDDLTNATTTAGGSLAWR